MKNTRSSKTEGNRESQQRFGGIRAGWVSDGILVVDQSVGQVWEFCLGRGELRLARCRPTEGCSGHFLQTGTGGGAREVDILPPVKVAGIPVSSLGEVRGEKLEVP